MNFLYELKKQQAKQPLHQPSAIERWLDKETGVFFDMELLRGFRNNYLSSGTQNWPNRIPEYRMKYIAVEGTTILNKSYDPDKNGGFSLWLDRIKGKRWLKREFLKSFPAMNADENEWCSDNLVGQPFHIKINNRIVTEPLIRHSYYVKQLIKLFPAIRKEPLTVFEIGGGYGSLARLLKLLNPQIKMVLSDFPERIALQNFFLSQSFPGAKISILTGNTPDFNADFILLPTWKVPLLRDKMVDLVVNTHSMQEMNLQQLGYYVKEIKRVTKKGFYCVNRYKKRIGEETIKHPAEQFLPEWQIIYDNPQPGYDNIREVILYK